MNISCSAEPCPVILDCSCVFYSGANLIYTGIVTNDTLCASLAKIDQKFKDAAIGYVFQNGIIQAVPGGPVKLGGTLNQNTIITSGGYTFALTGTIESSAFITTGGTSSQFVKGDGSLDSTSYQPAGNYISALTGDGTATGPGSVPFTLATTGVIPNTYGSSTQIPVITVDNKGRITFATSTSITVPPATIVFSGDVTGAGQTGTTIPLTLATVLSTPGTYGSTTTIPVVTVNAKGLVTGISQVSFPAGTGTVTSVGVSPGTGISASVANPTTTPVITITNTAPDQTVVLTNGSGINITGTYPNFTIANTGLLTVPDLQQVTIAGNETVLDIVSKNVSGFQVKTAVNQVLGQLKANSLVNEGELTLYDIAAGPTTTYKKSGINNILFPTGFSGTFALSVNGYTPNSTTGDVTIPVGTGTVTGTGTTNYVSKWSSSSALTDSSIFDNGTSVGVGTATPNATYKLQVAGIIATTSGLNVDSIIGNKTGLYGGSNTMTFWAGNNQLATYTLVGNVAGTSYFSHTIPFNNSTGSGTQSAWRIASSVVDTGANSIIHNQLLIDPQYVHGVFGTGLVRGVYYNPTVTSLNGADHTAWENTSGDIIHGNLATGGAAQMVTADTNGKLAIQTIPSFTSPLTTKGDIYVRNATVDTRLPVGLDTQILLADSSTTTGLKWATNTAATPLGYYGAFSDVTDQTAAVIDTGYPMLLGVTDLSNGVTVVSGSRVTIANTGIYNIQWSAQFRNPTASEHDVTIWLRKNGVDVPGSSGVVLVPAKHGASDGHTLPSWNFLLDVVGGDYYEFVWSTDSTSVFISFEPAGSPPPSTASVVLTVTQQSGIMAGTGITAINGLTGAVQTLTTGTSGLAPLFTSIGTTHTLDIPLASATGVTAGLLSNTDYNNFGARAAGGSFVAYYFNGSVPASVATYYQMSPVANIAAAANFTLAGNGLISQWLSDVGNPNRIEIPAGNWNFEMYMSASSAGGTPAFYVELLKYDGVTFTSIATSSAAPKNITGGTSIDLYLTSLAIPQTTLLVTDRLAIRVYIVNSIPGRSITMYTQDSHVSEVITNFAGGIAALNGLTENTQYFATGTTGTDFNISSATATHTFNLPTASATNRGALSTTDWTNFDTAYTNRITSLTTTGTSGAATLIANTLNIPQYAGATVGGVAGNIQYNDGTTFAGSNNLFWDNTNTRFGIAQSTPTSRFHLNFNQNSVTQSDANGILLANSTAAIAGTQSISPAIVWQGNGWKTTATAASQNVRFRADVLPVQGTTNPNGIWRLSTSVNGGAYVDRMTLTTTGAAANFSTLDVESSNQGQIRSGSIYANSKLVAVEQVEGGGGVPSGTTSYRLTNAGGLIVPKIGSYSTNTVGTKYYGIDNTNGFTLSSFNSAGNLIVNAAVDITGITTGANFEAASLIFRTQSGGTSMSEKMRIGGTGNVLIGTQIDGGFKLEVSGTARVTGNLTTNIATTQIAYSSSGILSGSANLYWDNTNNYLVNRGYYFFEFPLTSGCGLVGRQQGTSNLLFQMGFNAQAQYGGTLGTVSGNQFFVYNFQGPGGAANYYWGFNNSGDNYWGSSNTAYSVRVQQPAVGNIPLAIQGQTSQTARLLTITSTNAGTVGDLMSVFPNGNVAIGTTTDAGYKLDVNGTARFSSDLTAARIGGTNIGASGQLQALAQSVAGNLTARTTNAAGSYTPLFMTGSNVATAGTLQLNYETTNQLSFSATNASALKVSRAAIGIASLTNTAGAESGDMIFLTQSGGIAMSEKMRITGAGGLTINATNTAAGTTGNQTINKASGTVNIAAAGTTVTVTNNLVTTSSIVFAVIRTNDATATIKNVVPASGSFTINLNSATTAETSIGFFVIN